MAALDWERDARRRKRGKRKPAPVKVKSFKAKYMGYCADCGRSVMPGQKIVYARLSKRVSHERCFLRREKGASLA